jgi:hypothetical protein
LGSSREGGDIGWKCSNTEIADKSMGLRWGLFGVARVKVKGSVDMGRLP